MISSCHMWLKAWISSLLWSDRMAVNSLPEHLPHQGFTIPYLPWVLKQSSESIGLRQSCCCSWVPIYNKPQTLSEHSTGKVKSFQKKFYYDTLSPTSVCEKQEDALHIWCGSWSVWMGIHRQRYYSLPCWHYFSSLHPPFNASLL